MMSKQKQATGLQGAVRWGAILLCLLLAVGLAGCASCTGTQPGEQTAETEEETASLDSYERRLAMACIGVLPTRFFTAADFRVWISTETDTAHRAESGGVYVTFTDGGVAYTLFATPLDKARTQPGTLDLYQKELGYAALEITEGYAVPDSGWREVDSGELTAYAGTVTGTVLYEN